MLWVPQTTRDNETPGKRSFRRAAPLTFGVFGATKDDAGQKYLVGGSGILTHAFSGITAKHVGRYLMSLDTRADSLPKGTFKTQHSATVFQHVNPLDGNSSPQSSLWHVTRAWDSPLTDISLMQMASAGAATTHEPTGYFPWRLAPPPLGAKVYLIGFPGSGLQDFPEDEEFGIQMELTHTPAIVTAIYPVRRGTGMMNYPCFEVDRAVDGGFSGGPVIFEESLVGIVSASSSFEPKTWCSTLWPLSLLEYDSELPGVMTKVSDLFASGTIATTDWTDIRERIFVDTNEMGDHFANIRD